MRVVVQRVSRASVSVDGEVAGAIETGLLVLLGVAKGDADSDADFLVEKVLNLRIFPDADGKMNLSLLDIGGGLLVVSQFTLYGDVRKGRRPSFDQAAAPDEARRLYEYFLDGAGLSGVKVAAGVFQAIMKVELVNEGPVTIICDS
jgi:D-tyrosyl-tRNA(Tyr) deacylase